MDAVACLSNNTCTCANERKVLTRALVRIATFGHLHECEGENLSLIYTSGCVGYLHSCGGENLSLIYTRARVITEALDHASMI